jgi:2-amino-1-hydroxyethylphosphonate dioxygenase (glycine-forming)
VKKQKMTISLFKPETIVDEVFALYEKHGSEDYIGEPVSQVEHMSQAAALAEEEGFEDEVVLAAFFHDIGHLCESDSVQSMDGFGNVDHEKLGANYLREKGFSERIASLVESHVIAKRYLTYKYPEYYNQLSEASKATLEFQGGRMNAKEARDFEVEADAELFVRLRYWDDKAKEMNKPINNINHLKLLAISHLNKNN